MTGPLHPAAYPEDDADVPAFVASLGLPGILDMHVHVLPERLQAAVWRFFDRLEDPPWPIHYRQPEPQRLRSLAEIGVVRHTALAYAHRAGMAEDLNAFTLDQAAEDARLVPTFTFHPEEGVADYVARAIERGGQVAKVHLQVGRFDATDPRLDDVWPQLARHRIPVVMHAGAVYGVEGGEEYCGVGPVRRLLDQHPDLAVVIAHLGAPDYADFLALAEQHPSLHMDTAMVLTDRELIGRYPPDLLPRLRALADRILFGSDFPTVPHDYATQVRALARLELDVAQLRAVLHDNARRLLDRVGT